jgi:hypothetical protein
MQRARSYRALTGDSCHVNASVRFRSAGSRFRTVRERRGALTRRLYARSAGLPTQSPTMVAGLRRVATSVWVPFVTSRQRVPGFGHRHWCSPVVDVIDKARPRLLVATTSALPRGRDLGGASGGGTTYPRKPTPTTAALSASTDLQIGSPTGSAYAEAERVSRVHVTAWVIAMSVYKGIMPIAAIDRPIRTRSEFCLSTRSMGQPTQCKS